MSVNFEHLKQIKAELNKINFGKDGVIHISKANVDEYSFNELALNDKNCHDISGVCELCESKHCNIAKDNIGYKLSTMMHGAHSIDCLMAQNGKVANINDLEEIFNGWSDIPVLFLFENPSIRYSFYEKHGEKYPTKEWYFIHRDFINEDDYMYPKQLRQGYYAGMIYSLIKMFRLANAYATDVVKCGMNNETGDEFLGTSSYTDDCINFCVKEYLVNEIGALTEYNKNIVIFAFSERVNYLINRAFSEIKELHSIHPIICLMPHPANRLNNDYRKYVLFSKMYKALMSLKLKGVDKICEAALKEYVQNDPFEVKGKSQILEKDYIKATIEELFERHSKSIYECTGKQFKKSKYHRYKITEESSPFSKNGYVSWIGIRYGEYYLNYYINDISYKIEENNKEISVEQLKAKEYDLYEIHQQLLSIIEKAD